MASMPPQPPAPRRSSSSQNQTPAAPGHSSQQQAYASSAVSTVSEDSQVVILQPTARTDTPADETSAPPPLRRQDTDVKKCWICFADETEDTAESSVWRSPCPCALVAHENCLLDWIADMEGTRRKTLIAPKILCPQCKSEIHLARPWNPIVEAYKTLQRISARITTPAMILAGSSSVVYAFTVHGVHTIFTVFGQNDEWRILRPFLLPSGSHDILHLNQAITDFKEHWRLKLGIPLITPMLILSRTTLADGILPVLPILFLASQSDSQEPIDITHWPPSASLTVSVLPYIRGLYNAYYNRIWRSHELRWLKEIQPRLGENETRDNEGDEQGEEAAEDDFNAEGGRDVFEIRVEGDLWGFDRNQPRGEENVEDRPEGEAEQQQEQPAEELRPARDQRDAPEQPEQEEQEAHPLNEPPLPDDDNIIEHVDIPRRPAPPVVAVPQPQPPAQPQNNNERRLSLSTTGLAEKVLGALFFPTISSLSGELLRLVLPTSWTTPPSWSMFTRSRETGILQRRWGRSIVGGCLFVVLKDAVLLYVRWKMAQQHRSRRILNYDKKKKRVVG